MCYCLEDPYNYLELTQVRYPVQAKVGLLKRRGIKQCKSFYENLIKTKVQELRTDNGREYLSNEFKNFLKISWRHFLLSWCTSACKSASKLYLWGRLHLRCCLGRIRPFFECKGCLGSLRAYLPECFSSFFFIGSQKVALMNVLFLIIFLIVQNCPSK